MNIDKVVDQVLEVSGKERKGIDPHTGEKLPPHGRTYLNVQKGTTRHVKGEKAKIELKPFEERDWDAWSGAERFPDGNDPLVSEIGTELIAIVDANGIGLYDEDTNGWMLDHKFHTQQGAKYEAEHILSKIPTKDYHDAIAELGFEEI
jgi:hypothetical protein